jgi:hypothetical protein
MAAECTRHWLCRLAGEQHRRCRRDAARPGPIVVRNSTADPLPEPSTLERTALSGFVALALFVVGLLMSACMQREYNDAYYAEVRTVILLPVETKDPKATPPRPPYYQFQAARGYASEGNFQQTTFLRVEALYPGMQRFSPSRREAWYPKSGGVSFDVTKIFVRYSVSRQNDITAAIISRYKKSVNEGYYLVGRPPEELARKVPSIRYFRSVRTTESGNGHYVFHQPGGRTVVVDCFYLNQCHGFFHLVRRASC